MSFYVKPEYAGNAYRASERTPENAYPRKSLQERGRRSYSPSLSRWLSRDPIGEEGGLNLHTFVGNDPVVFVDPLGLVRVEFSTTITKPPMKAEAGCGLPSSFTAECFATVEVSVTADCPRQPGKNQWQRLDITSGTLATFSITCDECDNTLTVDPVVTAGTDLTANCVIHDLGTRKDIHVDSAKNIKASAKAIGQIPCNFK